ncbi:cytochrome P450 [Laetiporus sulphureus 93-53]|uniref:Cytochrome P450 n=1 Tax=Laetiporus sulphureus 93-53 TaxID=1314785 RepID=A0A165C195_9APHY|nr:cytochrome P450 [Laetiporus sulphureus 93-53]KZT02017.1 cytochrome P450 [Laetiporus sulphureus 93-53]
MEADSVTPLLLLLPLCAIAWLCLSKRRLTVPPGPTPLPIIGNTFHMPRKNIAESLALLSKTYSDIIYMNVLGRELVILNSAEAVLELFDQRGAIYSDRPRTIMAGELVGKKHAVLFHVYDEELKKHRRLLRNALDSRGSRKYWQTHYTESFKLLNALLLAPEQFAAHFRRSAGSFTLKVAYGYEVKAESGEDRFVTLAEELAFVTAKASRPGSWLVDSIPVLRYIPTWFPGSGFKRWAQKARKITDEFAAAPYMYAKSAANNGNGTRSFVTDTTELLESELGRSLNTDEDNFLKWTSASIYSGGTDTAVAANLSFVLFMALYPHVQRRAQTELDEIIGAERLAQMEDRERLPYIDALIKEVHRFGTVTPLVPHTTLVDDEYHGYRIPKGSWIMANTWAIMRDHKLFPQPDRFWPERFLPEGGGCTVDPRDYAFGYGRRRCPGLVVAESSLFIAVTHILAVFTISDPVNEFGEKITEPVPYTDAHISHPTHFSCSIKPRSQSASELITNISL